MAIANDPPPLAGFPDLGPDGAQVWRRFGDRRHVSQLLSAQVCAHSPAGSGAPSHLELRHSLQVLGCSAGGRPLPPPGLIAPDNSGPGLRPTASGCRPRPLVVRGSGQWAGPPHPPPGRDPRPLNPAKSGPPKGRIFPDFWGLRCSAQGGWGGSAHYPDPTAQSVAQFIVDSRAARATAVGGSGGPVRLIRGQKIRKNSLFF